MQNSISPDLRLSNEKTQSSRDDEIVGKLIYRWQYLFGLRGNWNTHWTEIAQRIYPMHSWMFQQLTPSLTQQGDKRNQQLYDATGMVCLSRFGAILDSLLTPRNSYWHQLHSLEPKVMEDDDCVRWMDQANQILFTHRYDGRANFSAQNQNQYKSLGAYGTGCLFIDDLAGTKGLRYRNAHLSECYLQENHQGMIDGICRYFMLTARQAYEQFGEALPETIIQRSNTQPETQYFFLHWVLPRFDRDPDRLDYKGMPYASYFISITEKKLLSEGGYRTFPYAVSRWEQAPNEAYGRSPAMDGLPALKSLNEMKKAMLKQSHRITDPILLAHDDGIIDSFNLTPGSMNAGGVSKDGRLLVQPLPTGNLQIGKEQMDEERDLIKDVFLVSLFQILTETPEMTAREVIERVAEKSILLAPTISRQQAEYLDPMIERELDILTRQGQLPPMPPLLKQMKGEYKVMYDSPISRSMKSDWVSGATKMIEITSGIAQQTGDRSVMDNINLDKIVKEAGPIVGMPAHWMSTAEEIAQKREAAARASAMAQTIQMQPGLAGMQANAIKAGAGPGPQPPPPPPQAVGPLGQTPPGVSMPQGGPNQGGGA